MKNKIIWVGGFLLCGVLGFWLLSFKDIPAPTQKMEKIVANENFFK